MTEFRRWLAGVLGALADRLYPPYPIRVRDGEFNVYVDNIGETLEKIREGRWDKLKWAHRR